MRNYGRLLAMLLALACTGSAFAGEWLWIEGEKPAASTMTRHPWWYDKVKKEAFSGGDFISNFNKDKEGTATYRFNVKHGGEYAFWLHANPLNAKLSYKLNGGAWKEVPMDKLQEQNNVADDGKPDLRFVAWIDAGKLKLAKGENTLVFRMHSPNENHGMLDCFVLSEGGFKPMGLNKPDQQAAAMAATLAANKGWEPFTPGAFAPGSPIDLRFLNEKVAGEGGFIKAKGGKFVHGKTGKPVRFWAVNNFPGFKDDADADKLARMMAGYGINLVRLHGAAFNPKTGKFDAGRAEYLKRMVRLFKKHGIYVHLSIYFPLWMAPDASVKYLEGMGGRHPYSILYFNEDFQKAYRDWWKQLLTDKANGGALIDDPAVMGCELVNEDSFFFWTFGYQNVPGPQMAILEKKFGDWAAKKHGSVAKALAAWEGVKDEHDQPAAGRLGFRPLWNIFSERKARDRDTAAFLTELQKSFYDRHVAYLRELGFKGVVCASNWHTANPKYFEPLERYSYMGGDFVDYHGYFGGKVTGDNCDWSVRAGHVYYDRSALRFDSDTGEPGKSFSHPLMTVNYNDKPATISETTWNRPDHYRYEAPVMFAVYGALKDTGSIMHFAFDATDWAVKPGFFMQPWTLMTPTQMGQFPAAALIYRQGLVKEAPVVARLNLNVKAIKALSGSPLTAEANLDALRQADLPKGSAVKEDSAISPLVHYVGKVAADFSDAPASWEVKAGKNIDTEKKTIRSATGEVTLDYGQGRLTVNAPAAQGFCGVFGKEPLKADVLSFAPATHEGAVLAVALDGKPLKTSAKILLQVMGAEKGTGFATTGTAPGPLTITDIGHDPWLYQAVGGKVAFDRPDAKQLKVTPLAQNGTAGKPLGDASGFDLSAKDVYYLISK